MIDSTVVKAHQHNAGVGKVFLLNALGRSHGEFTTKFHVVLGANGLRLRLHLRPGQTTDITAAPDLLALGLDRPRELLGDKGYGRRPPARAAIPARNAPNHSMGIKPQNARHAGPATLCAPQFHRANDALCPHGPSHDEAAQSDFENDILEN